VPAQAATPPRVQVKASEVPQNSPEFELTLETTSPVSWKNPYTFAANTNSQAKPAPQENQFLKGIDLGVPPVSLPRKSPDEENPYLQGLNLAGTPSPPIGADIKPAALSAMHESQLLSSHKLLSSFDWDDERHQTVPKPRRQQIASKKDPQPSLNNWLTSGKKQASLAAKPTHVVHKAPVTDNGQSNPYLQVFGLNTAVEEAHTAVEDEQQQDVASSSRSLRGTAQQAAPDSRYPLASFKWDDDSKASKGSQVIHHLSMARSASTVHEKATTRKESSKNTLQGWLTVAPSPKVPDVRAQKLQQTIEQTVADNRNPYLRGLDLEGSAPLTQNRQNAYLNGLS
jgi:hypothetical protein